MHRENEREREGDFAYILYIYCTVHINIHELYFLDRKTYRESKYNNEIVNSLKENKKNIYIIPEGGFNEFVLYLRSWL